MATWFSGNDVAITPERSWLGIRGAIALAVLGLATVCVGVILFVAESTETRRYTSLSTASVEPRGGTGQQSSHGTDWDYLSEQNSDIVAWVKVESADIDHPVVQDGTLDHYLDIDFWGNRSSAGCPFLDPLCSADGQHAIVYGHHFTSGGMFSALQKAYQQQTFDSLGVMEWRTPSHNVASFLPICSLSVDKSWPDIRVASFQSISSFRLWLFGICAQASARTPSWRESVWSASRCVTLVTCSSNFSRQRARTLVVFSDSQQSDLER